MLPSPLAHAGSVTLSLDSLLPLCFKISNTAHSSSLEYLLYFQVSGYGSFALNRCELLCFKYLFYADERRFAGGKPLSKWMRFSAPTPLMKTTSPKSRSRRPLWMPRLLEAQPLCSDPAKSSATKIFNRSGWRPFNMTGHPRNNRI